MLLCFPTFSDALAQVRRCLWRQQAFCMSADDTDQRRLLLPSSDKMFADRGDGLGRLWITRLPEGRVRDTGMASTHKTSAQAVRVIVVDDAEWIRDIAAQVVRQTLPRAEIIVKNDGLEALMAFQQGGADFVVTNHCMPHMNGMELIQELRQVAPNLPVVMISVHPEAKKDAEAAGANWFLQKEHILEGIPRLLLSALREQTGLPFEE